MYAEAVRLEEKSSKIDGRWRCRETRYFWDTPRWWRRHHKEVYVSQKASVAVYQRPKQYLLV